MRFHRFAIVLIPVVMMTTACMAGFGLFEFSANSKVIKLSEALIIASQHMLLDMVDAETGQRGYIITGSQTYLDIYTSGVRSFEMDVINAAVLAASNPEDTRTMKELAAIANAKLVEMAKTIVVRKDNGMQAAQAMIETGTGKTMMDEFRNVSNTFRTLQQDRINIAENNNSRLGTMTMISIIFSLVSLVVWLMETGKRYL